MTDYCFTNVVGKLPGLLEKIRDVGVPKKVTVSWLETIGFKSSNDRTLIRPLKQIGFVDSNGLPTDYWIQYRGSGHKAVLAAAIKEGYADLFDLYPKAESIGKEELQDFFRAQTSASADTVARMASTFLTLASCADFPNSQGSEPVAQAHDTAPKNSSVDHHESIDQSPTPSAFSPSVHLDIQIHISPDLSAEQIDMVFQSIAKNFYGKE